MKRGAADVVMSLEIEWNNIRTGVDPDLRVQAGVDKALDVT